MECFEISYSLKPALSSVLNISYFAFSLARFLAPYTKKPELLSTIKPQLFKGWAVQSSGKITVHWISTTKLCYYPDCRAVVTNGKRPQIQNPAYLNLPRKSWDLNTSFFVGLVNL